MEGKEIKVHKIADDAYRRAQPSHTCERKSMEKHCSKEVRVHKQETAG